LPECSRRSQRGKGKSSRLTIRPPAAANDQVGRELPIHAAMAKFLRQQVYRDIGLAHHPKATANPDEVSVGMGKKSVPRLDLSCPSWRMEPAPRHPARELVNYKNSNCAGPGKASHRDGASSSVLPHNFAEGDGPVHSSGLSLGRLGSFFLGPHPGLPFCLNGPLSLHPGFLGLHACFHFRSPGSFGRHEHSPCQQSAPARKHEERQSGQGDERHGLPACVGTPQLPDLLPQVVGLVFVHRRPRSSLGVTGMSEWATTAKINLRS
jgi:hypothetical protein